MLQKVDATSVGDEAIVPAASVPAEPKTKVDSVAICGSNPATIGAAPFGHENWAILACSPDNTPYGLNSACQSLPRVTEWFEVHTPLEDPTRPFAYLHHIATTMPTVWLCDKKALDSGFFKSGCPYPEKELKGTSKFETIKVPSGTFKQARDKNTGKVGFAEWIEERKVEVPNFDSKYNFNPCMFTSSIAYMLAKAIAGADENGIKNIGLWGIMQQSDNEYTYQKPGIQYFFGVAKDRGINIIANRESCLFDMPKWKW